MDDLIPEAGLDADAFIFSITPETLRAMADEIEEHGMDHLVIADAVTGEVQRYEVVDFDIAEWTDIS
jgi:hypothetical protein